MCWLRGVENNSSGKKRNVCNYYRNLLFLMILMIHIFLATFCLCRQLVKFIFYSLMTNVNTIYAQKRALSVVQWSIPDNNPIAIYLII